MSLVGDHGLSFLRLVPIAQQLPRFFHQQDVVLELDGAKDLSVLRRSPVAS